MGVGNSEAIKANWSQTGQPAVAQQKRVMNSRRFIAPGARGSDGQTSLLVGYRSSAEKRWIERGQAQPPSGHFDRRRYSGCGLGSCRNVSSVGRPKTMKVTKVVQYSWRSPPPARAVAAMRRKVREMELNLPAHIHCTRLT